MLCVKMNLMTGLYEAQSSERGKAEWPPHPERLLKAAISEHYAVGGDDRERAALTLLERQPPPTILAAPAFLKNFEPGTGYYFPKNADPNEKSKTKSDIVESVVSGFSFRENEMFGKPYAIPKNRNIYFIWSEADCSGVESAVKNLFARISYVGTRVSQVLCQVVERPPEAGFAGLEAYEPYEEGDFSIRIPFDGMLLALGDLFARSRDRVPLSMTSRCCWYGIRGRGEERMFRSPYVSEIKIPLADGCRPDLENFPFLVEQMRKEFIAVCGKLGINHEIISGHDANGKPDRNPDGHGAFRPLVARNGCGLMGIEVILPRSAGEEGSNIIQTVIQGWFDTSLTRTTLFPVRKGVCRGTFDLRVSASQWFTQEQKAKKWVTATPMVIDRKGDWNQSVADSIERAGFPRPVSVAVSKFSKEFPDARMFPSVDHAGKLTDCGVPVFHAVITFDKGVCGPVMAGRGRFKGLGHFVPA